MTRDEAEALATVVRTATQHEVWVQPDDSYFVVSISRTDAGGRRDEWTLYDASDWESWQAAIRNPL